MSTLDDPDRRPSFRTPKYRKTPDRTTEVVQVVDKNDEPIGFLLLTTTALTMTLATMTNAEAQ